MSAVDRAALEPELAMAWGRPEQAARIHASDLEALLAAARERDQLRQQVAELEAAAADTEDSTTRIEWGHRLTAADRARYTDGDRVWPCDPDGRFRTPAPCGAVVFPRGEPTEHVWRVVSAGGWRTGTPPEATP